uniref:Uncharacterized protein n=1 Tax=Solanum lycopersicum TaxID=4081 RepID=A0A3Q7HMU8_SOLLC
MKRTGDWVGEDHGNGSGGGKKGGDPIESYPNFSYARPITKNPTFLRLRGFQYISQSRNLYWRRCYPKTISRSRFMNYYREFVARMGRIGGRGAHRE